MLKINSKSSKLTNSDNLPDPWSAFVTTETHMTESKSSPDLEGSRTGTLEIGKEADELKLIANDHPLSPIAEDLTSVSDKSKIINSR